MQKLIHRQPSRFLRLPMVLLAIASSSILFGCDNRPTASMKVVVRLDDCTSEQTIALRANGEPVTTPELLSGVDGETEANLGCGLEELEYAFNTKPAIAKIEFDLDDSSEVTAFVPLDGKTKAPQPFAINAPNFRSVSVEVSFPTPNTPPLRGSVRSRNPA